MKLVNVLDRCPLRAKKRRDYQVWRRAVYDQALHVNPKNRAGNLPIPPRLGYDRRMLAYKDDLITGRMYAREGR